MVNVVIKKIKFRFWALPGQLAINVKNALLQVDDFPSILNMGVK